MRLENFTEVGLKLNSTKWSQINTTWNKHYWAGMFTGSWNIRGSASGLKCGITEGALIRMPPMSVYSNGVPSGDWKVEAAACQHLMAEQRLQRQRDYFEVMGLEIGAWESNPTGGEVDWRGEEGKKCGSPTMTLKQGWWMRASICAISAELYRKMWVN